MPSMTITIHRGDDELEVEVEYTISPYIPESGPTYDCGGQPAEGGEVELISVTIGTEKLETTPDEDDWLANYISENHEDDGDFDDERDWES